MTGGESTHSDLYFVKLVEKGNALSIYFYHTAKLLG